MTPTDKKENRGYIVWSIAIGGLLGFLINIFSNLYYGFFVVKNLHWVDINHSQLFICAALFLGLIGYLGFFIDDYPNTFEFSMVYWKRFQNYFFNDFWPGRFLRVIIGLYLILLIIGFMTLFYLFFAQKFGYFYATIIFSFGIILNVFVELRKKKHA